MGIIKFQLSASPSSGSGGNLAASDAGLLSSRMHLPPGAPKVSTEDLAKLAQTVEEIDAPKVQSIVASQPSSSAGPHLGGGHYLVLGHTQYFSDAAGEELNPTELADRQDGERRMTQKQAVYSANACYENAEERAARNARPPRRPPKLLPKPKRKSHDEERRDGVIDVRKR